MTDPSVSRTSEPDPHKAYVVRFEIVNQMECVLYAHNVADARARFNAGAGEVENTYKDYRLPGVEVRRLPEEDLDA